MTQPEQDQAAEALNEALETVRERAEDASGSGLRGLVGGLVLGRARRALGGRRRRRRIFLRFGFGLLIAVCSVATCSFGVDPSMLTASYGDPVPASSQDAAGVLTRGLEGLRRLPEAGALRLTLTESEATSALSLGLMMPELMLAADRIPQEEIRQIQDLDALRERVWAEVEDQRRETVERARFTDRLLLKLDPRIRTGDVQVRFEPNGEVVVAGYVQAWRFRQSGIFVVAPHARDGDLALDFVSGRLGRLPLPELVFDWLGGMLARAILLGREHAQVSEITVGDGTLTFEGRLGGS